MSTHFLLQMTDFCFGAVYWSVHPTAPCQREPDKSDELSVVYWTVVDVGYKKLCAGNSHVRREGFIISVHRSDLMLNTAQQVLNKSLYWSEQHREQWCSTADWAWVGHRGAIGRPVSHPHIYAKHVLHVSHESFKNWFAFICVDGTITLN